MTANQVLFTLVVNELQLTQEDLNLFTEPNVIHRKYCKQVVRTMNKYQFTLLKIVATFPPDVTTVARMQKTLIEFLEHNPRFQEEEYRIIWLKFAHHIYLNKKKVQITNNDAHQQSDGNQQIHMSFENRILESENHEHETQHNAPQKTLQLEDDELQIRDLSNRIMRLAF